MLEDANQGNLIKLAYMLARLNIRWNVSFMVEKKTIPPLKIFLLNVGNNTMQLNVNLGF